MKTTIKNLCKLFLCTLLWCVTFGMSLVWSWLFKPRLFIGDMRPTNPYIDIYVYVGVILISVIPTVILLHRNKLAGLFAPVLFGVMFYAHTTIGHFRPCLLIISEIFNLEVNAGYTISEEIIYVCILTAEICAWVGLIMGVYWMGNWLIRRFKQRQLT